MQDNRTIRHATLNDIDDIMAVLTVAREKMRRSGNANQWINGYPTASWPTSLSCHRPSQPTPVSTMVSGSTIPCPIM